MKHVLPFAAYLLEALSREEADRYHTAWVESGGEQRYEAWFNGQTRTYLDLEEPSHLADTIEEILAKHGFQVVNFRANQASKVGDTRNITKITKLVARFAPEHLDACNLEVQKESSREYGVVISRNPVDIAAMSTDRRWFSCMNIRTGEHRQYVDEDIIEGTIIAYVIRPDDKEVEDPVNRILLKPFENKDGDVKLVLDAKIYYHEDDKPVAGFRETVQNWLDSKQGKLNGFYSLNTYLYADGLENTVDSKIMKMLHRKYTKVEFNKHGYGKVEYNMHIGLIDDKGNVIIEPMYSSVALEDAGIEPLIKVRKYVDTGNQNTLGLVDYHGNVVVPCEYWIADKKGTGWELIRKETTGFTYFTFDGHNITPK